MVSHPSSCSQCTVSNLFEGLYATVGCHPTRSTEFDNFDSGPEGYLAALDEIIAQDLQGPRRVAAVGECGLGESWRNS